MNASHHSENTSLPSPPRDRRTTRAVEKESKKPAAPEVTHPAAPAQARAASISQSLPNKESEARSQSHARVDREARMADDGEEEEEKVGGARQNGFFLASILLSLVSLVVLAYLNKEAIGFPIQANASCRRSKGWYERATKALLKSEGTHTSLQYVLDEAEERLSIVPVMMLGDTSTTHERAAASLARALHSVVHRVPSWDEARHFLDSIPSTSCPCPVFYIDVAALGSPVPEIFSGYLKSKYDTPSDDKLHSCSIVLLSVVLPPGNELLGKSDVPLLTGDAGKTDLLGGQRYYRIIRALVL